MQLRNAVKKLEKYGFKVSAPFDGVISATQSGNDEYINLFVEDETVVLIEGRRKGVQDDSQTDYHAGWFYKSLSRAIAGITN